jgi:hypothetical protein
VRGLKLGFLELNRMKSMVAPHVGAWIETCKNCKNLQEL